MGRCPHLMVLLLLLVSCTSDPSNAVGPRLVQEVTLEPTAIMPTRVLSPTPSPISIPVETAKPVAVTIVGDRPDYVLVTATLPPSKTPTPTSTITPTFTATLPPTMTRAVVVLDQAYPLSSGPSSVGQPGIPCQPGWFFSQPVVSVCPLAGAMASTAAYQPFQQGFMIWVQTQDAIYVVYDSATLPRWEVFRDTYVEGAPETDESISPPPSVWQPRRGFGEVWRNQPNVRQRLGWAVSEKEAPYQTQVQIASDGTIFLVGSGGGIIALRPGGQSWERYPGS